MTPDADELLAANPDAVAHERTIPVDQERIDATRARGLDGGWGAGGLVERDGAVLLVEQDDRWFLPGGQRERGETLAEAARRELGEETGLTATIGDLLAVTRRTLVSGDDSVRFHFATYRAETEGDRTLDGLRLAEDPGLDDEDITSVRWHEQLPESTYDRSIVARLRG